MWSTSVVFPWSTWAMIAMLRMSCRRVSRMAPYSYQTVSPEQGSAQGRPSSDVLDVRRVKYSRSLGAVTLAKRTHCGRSPTVAPPPQIQNRRGRAFESLRSDHPRIADSALQSSSDVTHLIGGWLVCALRLQQPLVLQRPLQPGLHSFGRLRTGPSTGSGQALRQAQDRPFDRLRTGFISRNSAMAKSRWRRLTPSAAPCASAPAPATAASSSRAAR